MRTISSRLSRDKGSATAASAITAKNKIYSCL